jgi:hypothetical protein
MPSNRYGLFFIAQLIASSGLLNASPPTAAAADQRPQHWALLIGVNDYANVQHLRYCVADQESLAKQLIASGFPSDQVYLLDDKAEQQKFRPSKLNIEKQLEIVLAMPSPGDTVVLSFSGHGVQIAGKSYICPADCDLEHPQESMIPLDKVFDELSACKASLKLLIVDACRNNLEIGGKRTIDNARSVQAFGESLENPPEGISLLASCSPGQFARENEKLGHGVFIHFVLEGLQGKAADDDGVVRLGRLLDYTSLNTLKYVHDEFNAAQRPYYRLEGSGPVELARIDRSLLLPKPGDSAPPTIPAAQPRANGRLLFSDDFKGASPLVIPLYSKESMTFRHVGGEGELAGKGPGILPAMYPKSKFRDFHADFELRIPSPPADNGYGIVFRSDDKPDRLDWYYSILFVPKGGRVQLACWKNGGWTVWKTYPLKDGLFVVAQPNRVHLEVVGNQIRAFVNNALVFEDTDQTLANPGSIGLCIAPANSKPDAANFGRLKIYEPAESQGSK